MNSGDIPLLEVRNLKKHFKVSSGMLHAVDGVNLQVFSGRTMGIVGESGCGKSTLGRTILRLVEPTSGDILFEGESIVKYRKSKMKIMRKNMQIIFQDPYSSINPRMSVSELIAEYMIVNKTFKSMREIRKRTSELMDTVGLAQRLESAYAHELDGGRRQRIGIARALSLGPKFIVCDEPVSALDVSIQAQILNLLMDLQDEMNLTYMFITHNMSVVKHISDDIAVMYLGKCVELAQADELFANPLHPYTKALLAAIPVPDISMRTKKIEVIKGEVKNPINPKPGCLFASRCEFAMAACKERTPELKDMGNAHHCACLLFDK